MNRKTILSADAPAPVGPYVQALDTGTMVFFSGQIPLDPHTGELYSGPASGQARLALENLRAVVLAAGLDMEHIVRTTVYLTDMGEFPAVNEVYGTFFGNNPPARSCVEVSALPKGACVEIDAIAVR